MPTATKMPPAEDIDIASMWLHVNEGADGERDACRRVADWLDAIT